MIQFFAQLNVNPCQQKELGTRTNIAKIHLGEDCKDPFGRRLA